MADEQYTESVALPDKVSAKMTRGILEVTGPKGAVTKSFLHPVVKLTVDGSTVNFSVKRMTKNEKKIIRTFEAHVRNMCKGVVEGIDYKLKICSGHFPMNVSVKGKVFEIKNFIGEAVPRKLEIKEGVSVKVEGEVVSVKGIDKELTAQMAASIEKLTRRNGFDRRIFQDGIYITEKDGKKIE